MRATLRFLDVGQGDCTMAVDHEQCVALIIDCPLGALTEVERAMTDSEVSRPDLVVITHSDTDHMAGVVALARNRGAREVRWNSDRSLPSDPTDRAKWRAALRALAALPDDGVAVGPATEGVAGQLGSIGYRFLAPSHAMVSRAQADARPNHASAIIRLEIAALVALVGGDADGASWHRLISGGTDLHAAVFRLPHHGGEITLGPADATWPEVLEAVGAAFHVVSVGTANPYGHPVTEALEALRGRAAGARVLCTEVNPVCAGSAPLPRSSPGLPASALAGRGGRPGACRCAGTVTIEVGDTGWTVSPSPAEHRVVMSRLESPMCRAS